MQAGAQGVRARRDPTDGEHRRRQGLAGRAAKLEIGTHRPRLSPPSCRQLPDRSVAWAPDPRGAAMSERASITDPAALLPPPRMLRARLARALRDVDILRGLLRLTEAVARRDGRPADLR